MPGVGLPPLEQNLPPIVLRNYAKWVDHEEVRPGVLKHVAESGNEDPPSVSVRPNGGRSSKFFAPSGKPVKSERTLYPARGVSV